MPKSPPWLTDVVVGLSSEGPALFVGPKLALPAPIAVRGTDEVGELGGPYVAAVVAAADDLPALLAHVRDALAPGAQVVLLLPQPGRGMLASLTASFGPLGRAGRQPRSLEEQCGALLQSGFVDVRVVPSAANEPRVQAMLPAHRYPLDGLFGAGVSA